MIMIMIMMMRDRAEGNQSFMKQILKSQCKFLCEAEAIV